MDKKPRLPPNTHARPASQRLVSERSLRTARLASGLVMMAFVIMHLGNLSLSLISLEAAEAGRLWFLAIWRSLPGTVVLLRRGAHPCGAGAAQPLPQAQPGDAVARGGTGSGRPRHPAARCPHVIGTRVFHELTDVPDTYEFVVRALWITSPGVGLTQAIALVVVWAHGCLGLHFWLRYRAWYPRRRPGF